MAAEPASTYLDLDNFLADDFSPSTYANSLVLATNNPSDTPLDLSTPLSRVLFDVQEVDTHIDTLTTQNAAPIVSHTRERSEAAGRVLQSVEEQVQSLNESYKRLEREVVERYEAAEQVRLAAERMVKTLRLGRSVQRVVQLGRQLEGLIEEVSSPSSAARGSGHRALVSAARTVLELRLAYTGEEGESLAKVTIAQTVRQDLVAPSERSLVSRAQGIVREFSMSSLLAGGGGSGTGSQTFAQAEETKARATNALQTLYLLSPTKAQTTAETFDSTLLITALQSYLQTAITSSVASLARALATLPQLDRTLLETSARCQNIIALETLLENIRPPAHPYFTQPTATTTTTTSSSIDTNFLQPLLRHLDTSSLPSYFWRSMASQLTSKVNDILYRGGVSARTLRTNRDRVRDALRESVDRGYKSASKDAKKVNWEREAAVMVGSVIGPLQR